MASVLVEQLLDGELLERLQKLFEGMGFKYGWPSNRHIQGSFGHWNHRVISAGYANTEDKEADLIAVGAKYPPVLELWQLLKARYTNATLLRCYANQHTYGVEGYPHTDSQRADEYTTLIYLNREWRREWGGETLIWSGDSSHIEAVAPVPGRVLTFPGIRVHKAAAVSRMCPVARTTLMFKMGALPPQDVRFCSDWGQTRPLTPPIAGTGEASTST